MNAKEETFLFPVQRFFRLLKNDRKDIYYIYIYAIFSGLITLSLPLGVQAIIGLIAGGAMSASLIVLILIVTIATALTGILKVMQLTVTETIQRRIFTRAAFDFSFRIPRMKIDSMARYYPPELVNRFFDTLTLQKGIPKILMDFSTAILQILFGLILISFYHGFFILFAIVLVLILLVIFRVTGPGGLKTSLQESKYKYEVAYWLEEMARSMSTFKLAGQTQYALKRTDGLATSYLDSRKQHFRILLFQYGSIVGFKTVITASLLFLGSYLVINNQINIGQFVAAEIVVILVIASVEKLILTMETIYDVLTALEKMGVVTDMPIEKEEGLSFEEIDRGCGIHIKVHDLHFQFEDAEKPTLDKLSMEIMPNEKVCIAGYNGAGKSTFLQVITGLYHNFRGQVLFNGIPMKNINLPSLRKHIGDYGNQEDLFKGTVIENITLGKEVGMDKLVETCEKVGLNSYLQQLPNGYNTILQPEGRNVPQSVRTKIILARSIISAPCLLAVEGHLQNLTISEREMIWDLLTDTDQPWTLLVVSNDPVLAEKCDRVIIMEAGKVVCSGSFEEIKKSSHFEQVFINSNVINPC